MGHVCWWVVGVPAIAIAVTPAPVHATAILLDFAPPGSVPPVPDAPSHSAPPARNVIAKFDPPPLPSEQPLTASDHPHPDPTKANLTEAAIAPAQPSEQSATNAPLPVPDAPVPAVDPAASLPPPPLPAAIAALFSGGEDSLVARAIGSAEGTRTPDGQRTLAYYGHRDPGNQAWNLGSFSYQHGAESPAAADAQQLQRLQAQTLRLQDLATQQGLVLTREELLNGIDLANQAPLAALDRGYLKWLAQARTMGLRDDEAILWARTRSFLDPDSGQWNAPGLGNSVQAISRDQARRQAAIAQAIADDSPSPDASTAIATSPPISPPETTPETQYPEAIDTVILLGF